MKERKHHTDTYEAILDQIEQMIERMGTDKQVRISDITKRFKSASRSSDITNATIMLLKKYGIDYKEENDG